MEKFDDTTLFFDIVQNGERVHFIGPPMLNLDSTVLAAGLSDDSGCALDLVHVPLDRTQGSYAIVDHVVHDVSVHVPGISGGTRVTAGQSELFRNQNTIVTTSKNNDLVWIKEWASFYARVHGVTGALVYDNGSTDYSVNELLEALCAVPEIRTACVVDWPFKYGPQGGNWGGVHDAPWDSDFAQAGVFQHARHMFLSEARAVINADIDELLVVNGGQLQSWLDASQGYISYSGTWIENVPDRSILGTPRFVDFTSTLKQRRFCTNKWVIDPRRVSAATQWKTHAVTGIRGLQLSLEQASHRHFVGVNNGWKFDRGAAADFDPASLVQDSPLVRDLSLAFGSESLMVRPAESRTEIPEPTIPFHASEELVERLRADLAAQLGSAADKVWVYQDRVVVLEFSSGHARVAFDCDWSGAELRLKAVGRNQEGRDFLSGRLGDSDAKLLPNGKHWLLATESADSERFVEIALNRIGHVLYA